MPMIELSHVELWEAADALRDAAKRYRMAGSDRPDDESIIKNLRIAMREKAEQLDQLAMRFKGALRTATAEEKKIQYDESVPEKDRR